MSSTDPMNEDSSIPLEITQRTSPQQYPYPLMPNIRSSSSTRQTTPHQMYNCCLGHPLRNFQVIADSSSPVIIKIKSSNRSIPGVLWSNLAYVGKKNRRLRLLSSPDLTLSWTKRGAVLTRKSWQNSSISISQTGEEA